jgi:hypothetical protein
MGLMDTDGTATASLTTLKPPPFSGFFYFFGASVYYTIGVFTSVCAVHAGPLTGTRARCTLILCTRGSLERGFRLLLNGQRATRILQVRALCARVCVPCKLC